MALYSEQFFEEHDFPPVDKPEKVLVVASTPRSGSHMLGHALYRTGVFGFPLEYANPANLKEWKRLLELDSLEMVIRELQHRRTSPNGVFGIKLHYSHIRKFGTFNNVISLFPQAHYVLLTRKSLVKQAVSLSIARQTGRWIHGQGDAKSEPRYDFEHIDKCLREISLDNAAWRYSLEAKGCSYMEVEYENLLADFGGAIRDIAEFMNVALDNVDVPELPVTKKQGGEMAEEWCRRFITQHDGKSLFSTENKSFISRILSR
ncbi:MAG: Stf0 family sulfotransferase [Gammaproteobacteria bacterium]|nr:Stf0 family sulfotransferase [Gammaproteobacteria bacterium]MCW8927223.1 Stf0 family sulfotransferase [Gammaproteobacteria bacterium]MCW8959521.1 Stf0 family sulfotransferase [Gammaproteobacteria bacterium]MCW8971759.1 Stf0 family sulfotransferase [Gammaproteobacteria bacterium]MCW8993336.1 Stf0 family sulfotransferase [Gammaproteobacteria bacterium]